MTRSSTPTPGDDRRRDMSPEEKLIAQWEAQHDVAARGSRCDPLGLQHQLSRERLADRVRPPRGATASGVAASRDRTPPAEDAPVTSGPAAEEVPHPEVPPVRRHPWRRFHHHASEH